MKAAIMPLLALGACTMSGERIPPETNGVCSAAIAGDLVGQAATQELGAKALNRSGARVLRWIQPGMAVTMDYRDDRLNIYLDAAGKVERITCG